MHTIRTMLLTNWDFSRILRLTLGLAIGWSALQAHDMWSGLFSALFLSQAITGTGCCGAAGCSLPARNQMTDKETITQYKITKSNQHETFQR